MPEFAAAVYDAIIGSEMFGDYDTVRKGLDWFKQHFAKTIHGSTRLITYMCDPVGSHSPTQYIFIINRGTKPGWVCFCLV